MLFLCLWIYEIPTPEGKHLNMWMVIWAFIVNMIKNQGTTKKEDGLEGLPKHFNLQSSIEIHAWILESWE